MKSISSTNSLNSAHVSMYSHICLATLVPTSGIPNPDINACKGASASLSSIALSILSTDA